MFQIYIMENFFKTITENTSPLVKNIRKHRSILGAFVVLLLAGIFVLFTNIFASGVEVTWDGGGTTNNRSEAANWAGDQLPTSNDTVFFTTLSTKDVAIDT